MIRYEQNPREEEEFERVRLFKKRQISIAIGCVIVVCSLVLSACSGKSGGSSEPLVFADAGWDSIRFHNHVARIIIEEGYGYKTDEMPGTTPSTFQGLQNGDIDIYMEVWTDNLETYDAVVESGDIVELSVNFDDNAQGLYVPTYLIEGDAERGIEPLAPDLKSVEDLPKYWELFKDPEDQQKGRIYGAITGWAVDELLKQRMEEYGLDEQFNYFSPGSDAALTTSLVSAYENGEPWVGYYWSPTWVTGKYDLTLLAEPNPFPATVVTVAVNKDVEKKAPEVVEFLKHYQTSDQLTAEALAYMEENDADERAAAVWFLQEYEELWTQWVSEEAAEKVKASLQ
jgi:glycine betaine/proline transport system substrate-binding protein